MTREQKPLIQIQRLSDETREAYQQKCTSCGACCSYFAREPGKITADGPAAENPSLSYWNEEKFTNRWPDGESEQVDFSQHVMRTQRLGDFPACIALQGEIGREAICSIYETRPSQCRLFEPGSVMCLAARAWAGIREENGDGKSES